MGERCVIHGAQRAEEEDPLACWEYDGMRDCVFLSPSEVVAAARQHVDYEAAKRRFDEVYYGAPNNIELVIHETVNAALGLGIEGEEG